MAAHRTQRSTSTISRKNRGLWTVYGLPCTFLIYDIMLWSTDTRQIKLSADQYNVIISRVQLYSSSRSHVLLKLTADQVLVFVWIVGSCQVNLLKTEPGLKVKQIITVSSIHMFFAYRFCFFLIGFVIIKLKIERQTIYRKPHRKVE